MDIVDTFNHLIPSDQLDDTLLQGPNLESEVSDEFGAGHNLLEDSLKNMLSDKDPMLGSASTQFHLLDNDETNFQVASSAVVEIEDIIQEGHLKETGQDAIEEDLIIPSKNMKTRTLSTSPQSTRKSPRLQSQEPVRSMRESTLARRSTALTSQTVKKSPTKSTTPKKGVQKKQTSAQELESSLLDMEIEKKETEDCEQKVTDVIDSLTINTEKCEVKPQKESEPKDFTNINKTDEVSEKSQNAPLILQETVQNEDHSTYENNPNLLRGEGEKLTENNSSTHLETFQTEKEKDTSKDSSVTKTDFEESLVSSEHGPSESPHKAQHDNKDIENTCSAECEMTESVCITEHSVAKSQKEHSQIETCSTENYEPSGSQKCCDSEQEGEAALCERTNSTSSKKNEADHNKHDQVQSKKQLSKSKPLKSSLKPHGKTLPKTHSETTGEKKSLPQVLPRADIHNSQGTTQKQILMAVKRKTSDQKTHVQQGPSKLQKTLPGQDVKTKLATPDNKVQVRQVQKSSLSKRISLSDSSKSSAKQPCEHDFVREDHSLESQPTVSKAAHSQVRPLSLGSHKQQSAHVSHGKLSSVQKDDTADYDEREKHKLKKMEKGFQRQRRSSKSISLDEPPLFIPDNAPVVKKESVDDADFNEIELVWHANKHNCGLCKKPHGNRFMVGCGRCDDWFHGDCVGLGLAQAQQMEQEDEEFICLKCCAEEDNRGKSSEQSPSVKQQHGSLEGHLKPEQHHESKFIVKHEKYGQSVSASPGVHSLNAGIHEKSEHLDDSRQHKVKIFRKDSTERRNSADNKELENKKVLSLSDSKTGHTQLKMRQASGDRSGHGDKVVKQESNEKHDIKKKKLEKSSISSPSTAKKPSVEEIRQNVRESLKDILVKRLTESELKISTERAAKVALKTERELFAFFRDTDSKYKSKYRSLMFNLRDAKNNVLFKRVLKGEITPDHLIRMSPEELASKELAAWRQRENRHTIEMIEKEQREVERRPITKITHKGEIEIENQEQVKEPEAMEVEQEPAPKQVEEPEIVPDVIHPCAEKDTTSQHKKHLFDLNCKICTGRMAPPADDTPSKVVKVATTVLRRQSGFEGEKEDSMPSQLDILPFSIIDENKAVSPSVSSFASDIRLEPGPVLEDEATFLSRLECIWKGFINMPSVAKFVIKAYPVSGTFDHLTEDLPDSIQVGGRISPQMVWDYVEKIRASGTKEVCLIRFCPVTEEDQISYTLLFAYFSSRKRYGVVANNMKQVKDMYLIPLGSSEKIPYQLVPFDGPGLEVQRQNLLLGLIIRQRVKRDFTAALSTNISETTSNRLLSQKKSRVDGSSDNGFKDNAGAADEDNEENDDDDDNSNDFFNSLSTVLPKHHGKTSQSSEDEVEDEEETTKVSEVTLQEPAKPLRFLPGVLVGLDSQSSALDFASKPIPVDDILQSLLGTTEKEEEDENISAPTVIPALESTVANKIPFLNDPKPDRFIVKRKEAKGNKSESSPPDETSFPVKTNTEDTREHENPQSAVTSLPVSLKDKPPDVSTEAFLASLSVGKSELDESLAGNIQGEHLKEPLKENSDNKGPSSLETALKEAHSSVTYGAPSEDNGSSAAKFSGLLSTARDPRQAAGRTQQSGTSTPHSDDQGGVKDSENDSVLKTKSELSDANVVTVPDERKEPCSVPLVINSNLQPSYLQPKSVSQERSTDYAPEKEVTACNIDTISSFRSEVGFNVNLPHKLQGPPAGVFTHASTSQHKFPPLHMSDAEYNLQSAPPSGFLNPSNNVLPGFQPHPPPIPPLFGFPRGPPPIFHPPEPQLQNSHVPWPPLVFSKPNFPPHHTGFVPSGPQVSYDHSRFTCPTSLHPLRQNKGPERRYSDPSDRQVHQSDNSFRRDQSEHQSRQRFYSESHHERRGRPNERDQERDRGKFWDHHPEKDRRRERSRSKEEKERGHRQDDRYRGKDRDRHQSYNSEHSRYSDRQKDRHHEEEHEHRHHKERDKSREQEKSKKYSDYDKGKRKFKKDEKNS
ncbi:PHD finger protein 3 isoform X1 [Polypterus senegalus]|uniref:PHD finger protein 3 isoform X1 n=3 Tax=Polypterus senegalus TaxID=55291 RepID=UPI00196658E3|nr:PHD finger protein 3 isoform X1 [Polypterus senegalus]